MTSTGRTGVTAARGWQAAVARAGTKPSGDLDLALVVSDRPASVAGAFTTSHVVGAPIIASRPRVAAGRARGVLVSAGIANVATGAAGVEDAEAMMAAAAAGAGVPSDEMLVSCTGVIGPRVPVDKVIAATGTAAGMVSADGGEDAARAILTTDTRPKICVRGVEVAGRMVTVGGMAKGAGMIAPRMDVLQATLLCFITTDGEAGAPWLREVIARALPSTLNAITIDGCMSTSDTALLFANGASGTSVEGDDGFADAVAEVMEELAYQIVADGEGATKVIRVRVSGGTSDAEADTAAREVANSMLVKSAVWGGDPNWGRIAQALGQARGITLPAERLRIGVGGVDLMVEGTPTGQEAAAAKTFGAAEVVIEADLGVGTGRSEILSCDLTPEYVRFNAEYTT